MLILPFFRHIDWKNPPVITLLIILINSFVYFIIQSGDDKAFDKAVTYYMDSRLPKIEFPLYATYLQKTDQHDKHDELFETDYRQNEKQHDFQIYFALENDIPFQEKLARDEIVTPQNKNYAKWKSEREEYNDLASNIVTHHFGFSPAKPRIATLFTHMFLHGSPMHLIGNMVVLFIVGYSVEIILGWRIYSIAYILGGLAAVGFFWMIDPSDPGPLVGASGAISGVMGIYAALFGLRKINFFYFVFIYMGFFTAPALLILVVWLLNELIQYISEPGSHVAYMAHFGGLMGGALIGFASRHLHRNLNQDYMDKPQQEAQLTADIDRGVELMRSMKFEPAKRLFKQLLKDHPNNLDILPHMYTVSKTAPDSEDYHQTALAILQICIDTNQGLSLANQVFNEYTRIGRPKPRVNIAMCLKLGSRFCKGGFMETAEKIVKLLMPKAAQIPDLASLLAQMGNTNKQQNKPDKAKQYYQLLMKYFPNSTETMHILKAQQFQQQ